MPQSKQQRQKGKWRKDREIVIKNSVNEEKMNKVWNQRKHKKDRRQRNVNEKNERNQKNKKWLNLKKKKNQNC